MQLLFPLFFGSRLWLLLAALFSFFGLIHSYSLTPNGPAANFTARAAWQFALTYTIVAVIMLILHTQRTRLHLSAASH